MAIVFLYFCNVEGKPGEMWGMYRMTSQGHFLATPPNSARPGRCTAELAPPPRLAGPPFFLVVWPLQHPRTRGSLDFQVPCEICLLVFFHFLNIFLSSFQSHTPSLNNICFRGLGRQYGTVCSLSWHLMGNPFHDREREGEWEYVVLIIPSREVVIHTDFCQVAIGPHLPFCGCWAQNPVFDNMTVPFWQCKKSQSCSKEGDVAAVTLSERERCPLSSSGPNMDALGTRAGCPWLRFAYR